MTISADYRRQLLAALAGVSCAVLMAALIGGCATAQMDRERAEEAGVDPVDVMYAPLDDTVDEINEKMNAPSDGGSGNAGN